MVRIYMSSNLLNYTSTKTFPFFSYYISFTFSKIFIAIIYILFTNTYCSHGYIVILTYYILFKLFICQMKIAIRAENI